MAEVKRPVRVLEVNYVCDSCGAGMMKSSGPMDPKTGDVDHRCMICDHQQTFQWTHYPRIEYVEITD